MCLAKGEQVNKGHGSTKPAFYMCTYQICVKTHSFCTHLLSPCKLFTPQVKPNWLNAPRFERQLTMPTRGEVMNMVRQIADSIMQSLKILLTILMNQAATQVSDQQVPTEHAHQMNQLTIEVNNQRQRIEEIAEMLKQSGSVSPSAKGGTQVNTEQGSSSFHLDSEEDFEFWTQEMMIAQTTGPRTPPPSRSTQAALMQALSSAAKNEARPKTVPSIKGLANMSSGTTGSPSKTPPGTAAPILVSAAAMSSLTMPQVPEDVMPSSPQGMDLAWTQAALNRKQESDVGQETHWKTLPRGLRERPGICPVVHATIARSAHSRFCQVLPNKANHGRAHSSKLESQAEREQFFVSQLINVENEHEPKWMMACKEQLNMVVLLNKLICLKYMRNQIVE